MTVADFQKYLRALADALAAAKGASSDLAKAADALQPFAQHSMADFARFLALTAEAYRTTGKLPTTAEVPAPKAPKVTVTLADLRGEMGRIRERFARNEILSRAEVGAALAKFEGLKKNDLDQVVGELGYTKKPGSRKVAIAQIVDRLTSGPVAGARAEV